MARWDWEKIKYENPGLFCVSFSNWNAVSQRGKKKWSSGAQGTLLCWRQRGKTYEGMTEILFHFISLLLRLKDKRAFWNALVWNAELFIFSSADSIKKKKNLKKCRRAVLQLWSQQQWCVWAERPCCSSISRSCLVSVDYKIRKAPMSIQSDVWVMWAVEIKRSSLWISCCAARGLLSLWVRASGV